MMRLLRLTHSMNPAGGGVAEAIRQFGSVCENFDCALTVACLDAPDAPWLKELPFPVVGLGPVKDGYGYGPRLLPWLRTHATDFDAAVIDGLWQYHGLAARRAFLGKLPYYVMPHGMLDPWFKKTYPLKHLKKWCYWPWAEYRILRDAEAVIFTTEAERRKAAQSFWLYRTQFECVSGLGIEAPRFDEAAGRLQFARQVPDLEAEQAYLLFIGRLHEKKGVDLLINAYRQFEQACDSEPAHLVIAGPPKSNDYLRHLKSLVGDSARIHFSGMLASDAKWSALANAKAMILPSHQENFGIVVTEALSVGTPVLLSREVDIWKEICEAGAAWSEEDTEAGIFNLLQKQHAAADSTLCELRANAKRCFSRFYDKEAAAQRFLKQLGSI